jgi:hypothetical protein
LYTGLFRTQAQLFPSRIKEKYTETGDLLLYNNLNALNFKNSQLLIEYEIIVVTGDKNYAGTDANV